MDVKLITYGRMRELIGTSLSKLDTIDLSITPDYEFVPGVRYLVLWNDNNKDNKEQAYHVITKDRGIHLGPRSEGHFDISKMKYLITREGLIFKFIYPKYKWISQWLNKTEYDAFNSSIEKVRTRLKGAKVAEGISKRTGRQWYRLDYQVMDDEKGELNDYLTTQDYVKEGPQLKNYKIVRRSVDIDSAFNYFMRTKQKYGLDYETNNFPFDSPDFYHMGVAIAGEDGFAAYFDMEGMDTQEGNLNHFLKRYKEFLDEKAEDCYVYNVSFEMRCTYLLFKKLYYFHEASTININDGLNGKKYSLKYTAMRVMGVKSWDEDFDYLCDKLHYMMLGIQDKSGNYTLEPSTPDTYKSSDIWKEIASKYPDDLIEFDRLISSYWGKPFKCIPASILGSYCCIDSFNTVQLRNHSDQKYDDRCWSCYDNNLRLAAVLGIVGGDLDIAHKDRLENISINMIVSGRIKVIRYWLTNKLKLTKDVTNIADSSVARMLKFGYNPFECRSYLPLMLADTDSGVDEYALGELLDPEDYAVLIEGLKPLGRLSRRSFRNQNVFSDINNYFIEKYKYESQGFRCKFESSGIEYNFNYSIDEVISHFYYLRLMDEVSFLDLQMYSDDKPHSYLFRGVDSYYKATCDTGHRLLNPIATKEQLIERFTEGRSDWFGSNYDPSWIIVRTPEEIINYLSNIYNLQAPATHPDIRFSILNDYYEMYGQLCGSSEGDLNWNNIQSIDIKCQKEYRNEYVPLMRIDQFDIVGNYTYLRNKYKELLDGMMPLFKKYLSEPLQYFYIGEVLYPRAEKPAGAPKEYDSLVDRYDALWRTYQLDEDPIRCMHTLDAILLDFNEFIVSDIEDKNRIKKFYDYLHDTENERKDDMIDQYLWLCGHFDYHMSAQCYDKMDQDSKEKYLDEFWNTDTSVPSVRSFSVINTCNKIHKKYVKIYGTYLSGHFTKYNRFVNDEDDNLICTERFHSGNPHQTDHQKIYFPYQELSCKSKRWSSPYHTIPSKSECKKILKAPPGYLISYFDISGAEVRGISYTAPSINPDGTIDPNRIGDQYMVDCYEKRIDPYINLSQQLDPDKDMSYHRGVRSTMKTIMLGLLYGMGLESMATSAEVPMQKAQEVRDTMFNNMKGIARLIEQKGDYCENTKGKVETALGDVLDVGWDPDRWRRLGINQYVQNMSAVALGDGFFNNIYQSTKPDSPISPIFPVGVIHDSSQNYFRARDIFKLFNYYREHLTAYLKEKYFGVNFLFDLEIGKNFYDMCEVKDLDAHTLEIEGNYTSVKELLEGMDEDKVNYRIKSIKNKRSDEFAELESNALPEWFKPKQKMNYVEQFIDGGYEARYFIDKSKFILIIEEVH